MKSQRSKQQTDRIVTLLLLYWRLPTELTGKRKQVARELSKLTGDWSNPIARATKIAETERPNRVKRANAQGGRKSTLRARSPKFNAKRVTSVVSSGFEGSRRKH